jgi:hypothetical protein
MPFALILVAGGIHGLLERLLNRGTTPWVVAAILLASAGGGWTWSSQWIERTDETGRIAGAELAVKALAKTMGPNDLVAPKFPQPRYYVRLYDLPIRFKQWSPAEPGVFEDADNLYVLVRKHRESLGNVLDQRLGRTTGALDGFSEPEIFATFPDLQVFVMSRREPGSDKGILP